MKKVELIFIPIPVVGHMVSTIEFAKRLIHRDDRIRITILSMKWISSASVDAYTNLFTASQPDRVQLIDLPKVDPPSVDPSKSPESFVYALVKSYIPSVRNVVRDIVSIKSSSDSSTRVAGFVLDFFCAPMIDVATELDLPSYIFFASNAAFLGLMLYLPTTRQGQNSSEFEDTDPEHLIPAFVNPVPPCVLPSALFDKDGGCTALVKIAEKVMDAKGIMINTFEELEPYAVNCFFNGQQYPSIYPVGPVLHLNSLPHPELDLAKREKVMKWLDDQPPSSVVFLCFGSLGFGSFEAPQVKEMALGLEQSGYRFLWSLPVPPPPPQNDASGVVHYKNPEDILPEGFLERIQWRGMICEWVPQVEILAHKAIGGFVSHCGWNSILESLWYGVPIVTWPMYAEQQLNAFEMVKELGLAVEMRLDYRRGTSDVVMADEIEKAVRLVTDGESKLRKKVKEMSEMARKAAEEGGSSFNSIGRLIEDMIGKN
ncbi:hypothetical protein PTKIN_Ptkin03bG0051600 [Pterospermum kingtungense]